MKNNRIIEIVKILDEFLNIHEKDFLAYETAKRTKDPFKILVATIISQNTTEKNAFKAYYNLEKLTEISPHAILKTPLDEIKEAIKIAGLQETKAKAIKEVARMIVEKYNGDFNNLLKGRNVEEIRKEIMSIKGIGPKTVDVLLMNLGYHVIAIDTHIRRVAYRLGLAKTNNYREIQRVLQENLPTNLLLKAHLLLIKFGRTFCKARKPLCEKCPLVNFCYFKRKRK